MGKAGRKTDRELVILAGENQSECWSEIYRRYFRRIVSYLKTQSGGAIDVNDCQDLAQEVFIAAWQNFGSLKNPDQLRTWLLGIARNKVSNEARRKGTQKRGGKEKILSLDDESVETPCGQALDAEDALLESEEEKLILKAVAKLSPRQQQIFKLRHFHHYKIFEIAKMLGIDKGTVKATLYTVRQKLLKLREEDDG